MGKLFQEIKRRKVFRAAAIYAVVAWVLIQVADTIAPLMNLPESAPRLVLFLLIILYPIALFLAWVYEVTPDGIHADTGVQSQQTASQSHSVHPINYLILVLVLLAVGFQVTDRFLFAPGTGSVVSGATENGTAASSSNLSRRTYMNIGITSPVSGSFSDTEMALSPDGSKLVYTVDRPDTTGQYLYLRHLDRLEEQLLFDGFSSIPFFSHDSEWVGFIGSDGLNKVSIRGGSPQLVAASAYGGTGGFWSTDDTVYYTSGDRRLVRSSVNGGAPETLDIDSDGLTQSWPYLLPGDDALLYTISNATGVRGNSRINLFVQSTGEVNTIIQNAYNARYVPTGHIVFIRGASLWAVPFDVDRLETTGPERPVVQGVQTDTGRGTTVYAFSDDGLLVYLPGVDTKVSGLETSLLWVDRQGNEEVLPQLRNFSLAKVSPDGQRLAVMINDNGNTDIWTYDLARNSLSRLTFDESAEFRPIWTPDGERIVFASNRESGGLWWRNADGTGLAEPLLTGSTDYVPHAFTPDGTQLLYTYNDDIYTLTPGDEVPSRPLMRTEFTERLPALSPDGGWIAYASNETGRDEIYVRPFPNVEDGKWQISNEGGRGAIWAPNGSELFYRVRSSGNSSSVWRAAVETGAEFQHETPTRLVQGDYREIFQSGTNDISADGSRFLLQRETRNMGQDTEVTLLVTVENWFEELKRLAPPDPQ